MTMQDELKACPNPWCEALERDGDYRPQVQYSNFGLCYVACTSCTMHGPTCQHEIEAITAWNTRASDPALAAAQAEVERLREADRRKTETLKKASAWFLDYARQHDAKTPPDTVKAGTNYERAQYCETAAFDDGSPAVDAALWPELQEGQP
jgi:hypothetical protein